MKISHIDHVALNVRDLERSMKWYQEVLGLERRHEEDWGNYPVVLCAGPTCVALFQTKTSNPEPAPGSNTVGMRHLAFQVDRANFEAAQSELRKRAIDFVFEDHGIAHSIYFTDPDGHQLEITTYLQERNTMP